MSNNHSTSQFPSTCISSSNPLLEVPEPQYPTYQSFLHIDHIHTFISFGDHLINSHNLSLDFVLCIVRRKLMLVTLGFKVLTSFLRYRGNCVCPASWWRCNRNLAKLEVVYQSFHQTADTNHYIPVFQDQQARGTNHNLLLSCGRAG